MSRIYRSPYGKFKYLMTKINPISENHDNQSDFTSIPAIFSRIKQNPYEF
ncbi:hypothetical protein HYC85_012129 [Camellia sinensis]|uniref:Uncharacterized protein n=1 Tax=Camellia sinensis TaxID=4442 RepID=A0A7J7HEB4_CAMSI|nr:hypothetical protein HYC85_012129 [Camellia sinensis]